jgi:hypothetical protein
MFIKEPAQVDDGGYGDRATALRGPPELAAGRRPPRTERDLAYALVLAATGSIATQRDLDAYEALPDKFTRLPALQALARERALPILEAEREYLLLTSGDAETVETEARDLEQWAQWYGIELDIAPILDHADDLAEEESGRPDWLTPTSQPDNSRDESETDLHRIFAQFATPDPNW